MSEQSQRDSSVVLEDSDSDSESELRELASTPKSTRAAAAAEGKGEASSEPPPAPKPKRTRARTAALAGDEEEEAPVQEAPVPVKKAKNTTAANKTGGEKIVNKKPMLPGVALARTLMADRQLRVAKGSEGRLVETLTSVSLETGSGGERAREEFLLQLSKTVDDILCGQEWSAERVAEGDYAAGFQASCEALAGCILGLQPVPKPSFRVPGFANQLLPIERLTKVKLFSDGSAVLLEQSRRVGFGVELPLVMMGSLPTKLQPDVQPCYLRHECVIPTHPTFINTGLDEYVVCKRHLHNVHIICAITAHMDEVTTRFWPSLAVGATAAMREEDYRTISELLSSCSVCHSELQGYGFCSKSKAMIENFTTLAALGFCTSRFDHTKDCTRPCTVDQWLGLPSDFHCIPGNVSRIVYFAPDAEGMERYAEGVKKCAYRREGRQTEAEWLLTIARGCANLNSLRSYRCTCEDVRQRIFLLAMEKQGTAGNNKFQNFVKDTYSQIGAGNAVKPPSAKEGLPQEPVNGVFFTYYLVSLLKKLTVKALDGTVVPLGLNVKSSIHRRFGTISHEVQIGTAWETSEQRNDKGQVVLNHFRAKADVEPAVFHRIRATKSGMAPSSFGIPTWPRLGSAFDILVLRAIAEEIEELEEVVMDQTERLTAVKTNFADFLAAQNRASGSNSGGY